MKRIDHPEFRFRRRAPAPPAKWSRIIVHWAGNTGRNDPGVGDAGEVVEYIGREGSGGWYHVVIDRDSAHTCIDPAKGRAGHAGPEQNREAIGVCIAQPAYPGTRVSDSFPVSRYSARAERTLAALPEAGHGVASTPYASRLYPVVFTLDPQTAANVARVCAELCDAHGIPRVFYATTNAELGDAIGVVCHHNVTRRKWDCVPWIKDLASAFEAEGFALSA